VGAAVIAASECLLLLLLARLSRRYGPQFLGMLEDPADGMGCWSLGSDTTLVGLVTNATFANFAKLCQGGYGSRPLQAGHTMVAINPDWTGPQDIGQFWERLGGPLVAVG